MKSVTIIFWGNYFDINNYLNFCNLYSALSISIPCTMFPWCGVFLGDLCVCMCVCGAVSICCLLVY